MINCIFHQGSGLGNQLHRYVATRVLALDKGYAFAVCNPELFKGDSFMTINKGVVELPENEVPKAFFNEKKVIENGIDIRGYDPEINFVRDYTVIDGEFQDPRYFEHRMNDINRWLKVDELFIHDDVCVIGFRGGEYALYPDLFLTQEYWSEAIAQMLKINPEMQFEVHTDDPNMAQQFFPDYPIVADIGYNWRSMRYAKYAIIANSSFYILPRLLQHHENNDWADKTNPLTIAPRYWARHNTKVWALPQNYYKQFSYI